jgi:hypothetical protein
MDRESGRATKSERKERAEEGRVEGIAGTIDGDFVAGDSVSSRSGVSGIEGLYRVVYNAEGGRF